MTWRIDAGDARAVLAGWPAGSVQCVCTSPPYWGLRSYSTAPQVWGGRDECAHEWGNLLPARKPGQVAQTKNPRFTVELAQAGHTGAYCAACGAWRGELGSEPTVEQYVANLVQVFRAVRRVLRPDGTLFINIGDSYSNAGRAGSRGTKRGAGKPGWTDGGALGDKQLLLIPARVALALQADGWYLRSDIIWNKPNAMPESVTDRPTKSYEHVFLFSQQARYYYDADALREPNTPGTLARLESGPVRPMGWGAKNAEVRTDSGPAYTEANGRNARDVWTIAEPQARLRDDLSPEQRAYVIGELVRRGLL